MKSGLKDRNNSRRLGTQVQMNIAVSMKSGLKDRNNLELTTYTGSPVILSQ